MTYRVVWFKRDLRLHDHAEANAERGVGTAIDAGNSELGRCC